jgi:hypothetical protein
MDDLQDALPPIEGQEAEAREWAYEIYSTCRCAGAAAGALFRLERRWRSVQQRCLKHCVA